MKIQLGIILGVLVGLSGRLAAEFVLPVDVTSPSWASWNGDFYPGDSNLADGWRAFDDQTRQYGGWGEQVAWRAPAGGWVEQTFPQAYTITQIAVLPFMQDGCGWGSFDLYAGASDASLQYVGSYTTPSDGNWSVFDVPSGPAASVWRLQSTGTGRGGEIYLAEVEMAGTVPEPSAAGLLMIGATALALRRGRRRGLWRPVPTSPARVA